MFSERLRDFFEYFASWHAKMSAEVDDIALVYVRQQLFGLSHENSTRFAVIHIVRSDKLVDELLNGKLFSSRFLELRIKYTIF